MAEDDDDEAFGDFAFAPFQSNSLSNGLSSSAEEGDEWGDFVQPPSESKHLEAATNGDHRSGNSMSPTTWVKPGGALPLSIFGDVVEEEAVADDLAVPVDFNRGKINETAEGVFGSGLIGNGVSNSKKFNISDLYDRCSHIEPESLAGSDFIGKVDSVENGAYSSANHVAAGSAVRDHNQLQITNKSDGLNLYMSDPSMEDDLFGGWTGELNGYTSNLKTSPENGLVSSFDFDMNGHKQQFDVSAAAIGDDGGGDDDEDDEWDFKEAHSEYGVQNVNNNADLVVHEVSESSLYSSGTGIGSMKSLDLFGTSNGSIDFFASSTEPVDYFGNSSGTTTTFQEVDLIGNHPISATLNGFTSDEQMIIEQNNVIVLDHQTDDGIEELDKDFGEFSAALAETEPEPNGLFIDDVLPPIKDVVQTTDGTAQEKDIKLNYHKDAIPLSIFGDEEPESVSSSDAQDFFSHQSIFAERSNPVATTSVKSINDMISNLYSLAEQAPSKKTVHNLSGTQLNPSSVVSCSNLVDDDDDDDDDDDSSWDFKDASPMEMDVEASLSSMGDRSISSKLKLDNYLEFYLKLKQELCFVVKHHIDRLKNAQGDAALFGDIGGAFDSEFQLACDAMNFLEEGTLEDYHTRESHLHEFAQVLLEPQFQRLESEYHLSKKLSLVEKDLGSSVELLKHTNVMLKILNTGTLEEQKVYVSLWSEMLSVCAQELRHGASIWNHAVAKRVQSQLLSEHQGRKFVLALGEIYRVVVVLGASAKLFKPWILSGSVDSPSIYILLEECRTLWSTSGLEEALSSVSAPNTLDDTSLFNSIKRILSLDVLELANYVFAEKGSRCCLSLLTAGVVPELKVISWGNEQCFVTLANLWANLISSNFPKLPQLSIGAL